MYGVFKNRYFIKNRIVSQSHYEIVFRCCLCPGITLCLPFSGQGNVHSHFSVLSLTLRKVSDHKMPLSLSRCRSYIFTYSSPLTPYSFFTWKYIIWLKIFASSWIFCNIIVAYSLTCNIQGLIFQHIVDIH